MENFSTLKLTIPTDKVKLVLDMLNTLSDNLKFPIKSKQQSEKKENFSILKYAGIFDGEFKDINIKEIKADKADTL